MFYEGKNEEPVKVDGTLVVYAFDETDRDANNARPDRKYVFTPEQVPPHYSKSKIGHSYSVWLPWDQVGGVQKEITLIVRFQPKEGPVAIGEPARQLLPGRIVANEPGLRRLPGQDPRRRSDWGRSRGQRCSRKACSPHRTRRRIRKAPEFCRGVAAAAAGDDNDRHAIGIVNPFGDQLAAGVASGWDAVCRHQGRRACRRLQLPAAELSAAGILLRRRRLRRRRACNYDLVLHLVDSGL